MGAGASGIGRRNEWPCVGDPDTWETGAGWFGCGATGSVSILALMPLGEATDPDAAGGEWMEPTLVHITVCPRHVRGVRQWLKPRLLDPDRDLEVYGTETVLREWGQLQETMGETRILRMVKTA